MQGHDELCVGALKAGMCDCDFIAKIRMSQIERDAVIINQLPTKGGRGKWLLKWKATSALHAQLLNGVLR